MQDLSTAMLNHEEAIEHLERHRWNREEIECKDYFAVILEKRQPTLAGIAAASNPPKIPGHAPFTNHEAELLKFSVNFGGAPVRVLLGQALDQDADLSRDLGPTPTRPGSPAPVKPKPGAMPADHGLRFDDDKHVRPTRPEPLQRDPEQPVEAGQAWARSFSLEHGDLLSQGKNFQGGISSTSHADAHPSQH